MRRGEIYRVQNPPRDPKQFRAFVVVSRQPLIDSRYETVICAPIYSEGQGLATQVRVGLDEGLKHESWIMCDNLTSLAKTDLSRYIGSLSRAKLGEVNRAMAIAIDLHF
jgi:mRNA interferase MazF